MDNSYRLDPSEHERVYAKAIEPASFLDTSPVEHPKITIVGGQTGAGKTRVLELSMKEFDDGNVVIVNTDDLRAYHPRFEEIVDLDDRRAAERTHEDASAWNRMLLSRSIETRRNVILEGVFKDGKDLALVVQMLKKNGYEVTFRIVAVHERYSVWGLHKRYEKERLVRGHGRYVTLEYHNECYHKLLDTVDLVERQGAADLIEVYNRDGQRLYPRPVVGGERKQFKSARAAIENERERKVTEEERARYKQSWERVFEYMEKRGAPPEEFERLNALADGFINEV
jgi:predicted ABC-type ATPase